MGTVFLMLFITGIMNEMGLFQRSPILPVPGLIIPPACSAASTFVVGLGSALAANAMTPGSGMMGS